MVHKKIQRFNYSSKPWLQKYSAELENIIRKTVREEVEQAFQRVPSLGSRLLPNPAEARQYKLQFDGKLLERFYTGNKVEAEGSSPVQVSLLDALTGHVVTDIPLSAAKVQILILHGDFKAEQLENWSSRDFNANIVCQREGKRPLIVGQDTIALRNGIAFLDDICITDNSSWVKSKKFRLGAVIIGKEELVREGVSCSFEVKDRRGELYQKHKILSPEDEVWRVRGIAKGGELSRRLADHQIYTIQDFLRQYYSDESLLRRALDVPAKRWEAIVQMATSCSLLPQFCAPPHIQGIDTDQPWAQISQSLGVNQDPVECSPLVVDDNALLTDILGGNSCEDGHDWCFDYTPTQPSSPTGPLHDQQDMLNHVGTSSWFPGSQSMWVQGNNYFTGSSSNSSIRLLTSIPPEIKKPRAGWSKVRAVWKILVKHDEATANKGKFPGYSE